MERPTINTIVTDKSCVAQHLEVSTTKHGFQERHVAHNSGWLSGEEGAPHYNL